MEIKGKASHLKLLIVVEISGFASAHKLKFRRTDCHFMEFIRWDRHSRLVDTRVESQINVN
jgi:hypothetical protein